MVLSVLKSLFGGPRQPVPAAQHGFSAPLAPGHPFCAIGDIHGRDDLLVDLLARLDSAGAAGQKRVFLGDYVDRGPASAAVLARLHDLARQNPDQVVCLMGNHERMLLEFIDDPVGRGQRWLRNGGAETLASYGVTGVTSKVDVEDLMEVADAFEAALPEDLQAWLRRLPRQWQSGNVVCVHAAMDPARAPDDQDRRVLLWGHDDFLHRTRKDGIWVVHGHSIVKEPQASDGRIAVDTGAYQTGRLTAAEISPGGCRFL